MLTRDERKIFQAAYHRVVEYGPGEFDPDMAKAIKALAVKLNGSRQTSGMDRLLMGTIARRLDQIAGEIDPDNGDYGTIMIAVKLRNMRDRLRAEEVAR
jgi:hypothetical protein